MAGWRKYFTTVPSQVQLTRKLEQMNRENSKAGTSSKFASYLPEVYSGAPNRIERYVQYEQADLDSEINRSLDTIAEFCTQNWDEADPNPFRLIYRDEELTETEITLLKTSLEQWNRINRWNQRIFRIFRNTIKYGDQFFIRDPETFELLWVDPSKVEKIVVNEAEGKAIEQFVIRDLDFNLQSLVATNPLVRDTYSFPGGYPRSSNPAAGAGNINYGQPTTPGGRTSRFYNPANSLPVEAVHVVHISLSEGMDQYWPFGVSILEAVYKTYKQKDLLEDCILIYRIVRAPERRVFYIDVGQLQGQRAMAYVERVKNEIYQRRLPNRNSMGGSVLDTAYNPISITEDFFLATNTEQRGTRIESLAAGENLGCFSLDTKIKLLDGRDLSILDIESEMREGKQLWTYSCHPVTGEIAPGKITWAGKTRSNAKVLRITLDNGETITCTPDHKFPLRGVGFVEAKDLPIGQSLLALYTRNQPLSEHQKRDYTQYYDHIDQSWEYVHRMVAKAMRSNNQHREMIFDPEYLDMPKDTVHHVDHNRYNNSPENLAWMNWHDHRCYHSAHGFSLEAQKSGSLAARKKIQNMKNNDPAAYQDLITRQIQGRKIWRENLTEEQHAQLSDRISTAVSAYWQHATPEAKAALVERCKVHSKQGVEAVRRLAENDPEYWVKQGIKIKDGQTRSREENPDIWIARNRAITAANKESWKAGKRSHVHSDQQFTYTEHMLHLITTVYVQNPGSQEDLFLAVRDSREFVQHWAQVNNSTHNQVKFTQFGRQHLNALLDKFGLDWRKFKVVNSPISVDPLDKEFQDLLTHVRNSDNQEAFRTNSGITRGKLLKISSNYGLTDYGMVKAYADQMNHRIVSIEYLDETMDVGTLTVDGDHELHDWHTYALSVGVFVKNSIDDLRYFSNKLMRGLGIPSSYLPTGPEDGQMLYNDGKVGTAFIQEYRFNKYCQRLQNVVSPTFDREFKMFLKNKGIEVTASSFELAFNPPQSFSEYRKMGIDQERINVFGGIMNTDAAKYLSKRFALERYLGWTQEDILENERMWKEENAKKVQDKTGVAPMSQDQVGLGAVGVRPEMEMPGMEGAPEMPEAPPEGEAPAGEAPGAPPPAPAPGGPEAAPAPGGAPL